MPFFHSPSPIFPVAMEKSTPIGGYERIVRSLRLAFATKKLT